jgi:hypothetical protein
LESDEGTLKINMINMIDKIEKAMIEKAKIEKAKIEKAKSTVKAVSERVSEPVEKDESLLKEAKSKMDDMVILKRDGIGLFQLSEIDKWDITSLERLKEEIKIVRSILTSVNKKGYVNDTRLIDYPLYAELVMAFVELKDEDKINGSYQEILEKKESLLRTHEKINLSR